jgi:hypothetical protein
MVTILIFGIAGFLIGCGVIWEDRDYIKETLSDNLFALVVLTGIGLVMGLVIALFIPQETEKVKNVYFIESMNDNSRNYYLGSSNMNYTYYYKENGGFKMEQIHNSRAVIFYTKETPRVEALIDSRVKSLGNKFSVSLHNNRVIGYEIYIPEGSIKNSFKLDGE